MPFQRIPFRFVLQERKPSYLRVFLLPVKVYISPGLAGRRTYPPLHPHLPASLPSGSRGNRVIIFHILPCARPRRLFHERERERMRAKGRLKGGGKKRGQTNRFECRAGRDTVRATNEFRRRMRRESASPHGPLNALTTGTPQTDAENALSWNTRVTILRVVVVLGTVSFATIERARLCFARHPLSFHTPSVTSSLATGASTRANASLFGPRARRSSARGGNNASSER